MDSRSEASRWHSANAAKVESIMSYLDDVIASDPRSFATPLKNGRRLSESSRAEMDDDDDDDAKEAQQHSSYSPQTDPGHLSGSVAADLQLSTLHCGAVDVLTTQSAVEVRPAERRVPSFVEASVRVGKGHTASRKLDWKSRSSRVPQLPERRRSDLESGIVMSDVGDGTADTDGYGSTALKVRPRSPVTASESLGSGIFPASTQMQPERLTTGAPLRVDHSVYNSIKSRMDSMRFENDQLKQDNERLREALATYRLAERDQIEHVHQTATKEMEALRSEVKRASVRYAQKVEQLLKDKQELVNVVENLKTQVLEEQRQRDNERAKLETAHSAALSSSKSKWQANERTLREKWKEAESKRIKESTLRSLEPDIALLISRHKADKARLAEEFRSELERRDEQLAAAQRSTEELKAKLARDAEEFIANERSVFRDRLAEETERVRRRIEEDRKAQVEREASLEAFHHEQEDALKREMQRLEQQLFTLKSVSTKEQASLHEAVAMEVARITAESDKQLRELKDRLLKEFSDRERAFEKQNCEYLAVKEAEMKRRMEAERDNAVAHNMQKMEEERVRAVTNSYDQGGLLREKYVRQQQDLERLRTELVVVNAQLNSVMDTLTAKQREIDSLREESAGLRKAVETAEQRVRQELDTSLQQLDREWQQKLRQFEIKHVDEVLEAQHELAKCKQEWNAESENFDMEVKAQAQKHHSELVSINNQMMVALTKKDNAIRHLQEQNVIIQDTLQAREQELDRHRLLLT